MTSRSLPLLFLGALLLPAAMAPASAPAQESATPELDRSAKVKRVLRLAGGGHLRTLAHFEAGHGESGHWRLRRDGAWMELDEASVVSWKPEAELLREARRLGRDIEARDHGRRVELARWMTREGLGEEASEELGRVLALEPDFEPALELLRSDAFPRPSAAGAEADPVAYARRLAAAGVAADAVDRELLILGLARLEESEAGRAALREVLGRELVSGRILRRTFAAHALRRLDVLGEEEVFALMQRCVLDTSRPVRAEASRAIASTGEPGIIQPIVRALESESRAVRTNAAESLGMIGSAAAVPALVTHFAKLPKASAAGGSSIAKVAAHINIGTHFAYVGDFDLEIAQGASIADPIVMQGQEAKILDARLGGISGYTYQTEYRTISSALKQLTGASPGSSPDDWQRWYDANREGFESAGERVPQ